MAVKTVVGNAHHLQDLFNKHPAETDSFTAWWSSPEKFAEAVESWDKSKAWHDSAWEKESDFYGTKTMEEAIKLARYGWQEGVKRIKAIRTAIHAANPMTKKPITYSIAGSTPNVPRAIAGNIMNMRTVDLARSRKRPVITLLSDMSAHCGHDAEEFLNRAAVVAALIDRIENEGYCCEVIAYGTTKRSSYNGKDSLVSQVSVMLKNSNQPVDMARLAFGLGHPAMFRRLIFAQWGIDKANERLGSGLGHCFELPKDGLHDKAIYMIPSINSTNAFDSPEKAVKEGLPYIIKDLKEQGCPAV